MYNIKKLSDLYSVSRKVSFESLLNEEEEKFILAELKQEMFKNFIISGKIEFGTNYILETKKEIQDSYVLYVMSLVEVEIIKLNETIPCFIPKLPLSLDISVNTLRTALCGDGYLKEELEKMSEAEIRQIWKDRFEESIINQYKKVERLGLYHD